MSAIVSLFNSRHSLLHKALADSQNPSVAIDAFLAQHALVHSQKVSDHPAPTYADKVLSGLIDEALRAILPGTEHSIAWILWHMARIEDVTMNLLLVNKKQVFTAGNWKQKLKIPISDTGNLMPPAKIVQLGKKIDIPALLKYRNAVGKRTRQNVKSLDPALWKHKVDPARIARLVPEGAMNPAATDVMAYWSGLTYAGLLLMPPTRHNLIHLNEILKIKQLLFRS